MSVHDEVTAARRRARQEHARFEQERAAYEEEHRHRQAAFNTQVRPNIRRANPQDYERWLTGYLEAGGTISHAYDYPMTGDFCVALRDLTLPALYGSSSISIIVPEGITISAPEGLGHCKLYHLGSPCWVEGGWVPIYTNTLA